MNKTKNPPFPGSVFISESRNNRNDLPRSLEVPIFMNKRVQVRKNYEPHRRYIEQHKKIYECPKVAGTTGRAPGRKIQPSSAAPGPGRCPTTLPKLGRTTFEGPSWNLAPNRYRVKEVSCSRTPLGGAYWSRLERTDKTMPGRFAPPISIGESKFYEFEDSFNWNSFCKKNKGVFLTNARNRRATSRLMVNDMNLCWRDKNLPGPDRYTLETHCMSYNSGKQKQPKKIIYRFLPNSVVPEPEYSFNKRTLSNWNAPGPGRFDPLQVACICEPKKILDIHVWDRIEEQKRRRFRRLPYKKIKADRYRTLPSNRNIRGHGHTYVFKSKYTRNLPSKKKVVVKSEKLEKFHMSVKYIDMINHPQRTELFSKLKAEQQLPRKIRFNTMYRPVARKKLRESKKVAFLSGTPRFPGEEAIKVTKDGKKKKKKRPKFSKIPEDGILNQSSRRSISFLQSVATILTTTHKHFVYEKLSKLPKRLQPVKSIGRENIFSFAPLPPARLLLREEEIGRYDSFELPTYILEITPDVYFKDIYCENFVVKLKKDSLGRIPLDLLSINDDDDDDDDDV